MNIERIRTSQFQMKGHEINYLMKVQKFKVKKFYNNSIIQVVYSKLVVPVLPKNIRCSEYIFTDMSRHIQRSVFLYDVYNEEEPERWKACNVLDNINPETLTEESINLILLAMNQI